jgi:signal transduction histidine kinase
VCVSASTDELNDSSVSASAPGEDTIRFVPFSRAIGRAQAHPSVLRQHHAEPLTDIPVGHAGHEVPALRRQLSHDIRHELSTIMLLASLLDGASDVGPDSQQRARQILGEVRWLDHLQRAYDDTFSEELIRPDPELIRLDLLASDVVTAIRLSTSTMISFTGAEASAHADGLAFWRALRNVVGNAVRAAGPDGRVEVRVEPVAGWVVVQVDDDGPGFGAAPPGTDSLGLEMVRECAAAWNGHLEIRRGDLGGCCVRLRLRAASPSLAALGRV